MIEYEYSFKVDSIEPYINYCKKNGYVETSVCEQNRVVYENKNNKSLIARITTVVQNGKKKVVFDCKNVENKNLDLKESKESIPLSINSRNEKNILSILEVLGFYRVANNTRIRYVYRKGKVTFEIDNYLEPKMQVVAIEGNKEDVDKVYCEINTDK